MLRRLIGLFAAAALVVAQATPAVAQPPGQAVTILGRVPRQAFSPVPTVQCDFPHNRCLVEGVSAFPVASAIGSTAGSQRWGQWADGHYSAFPANTIRLTDVGLDAEGTVANTAVNSNDLTQASWVKTNITATKNQTGPDNIPNSATLITATAPGATVFQAPPVSAAVRNVSYAVRCDICTGAVSMTIDGSTFTPISASNCNNVFRQGTAPSPTAFERCFLTGVVSTNIGFKLANSGDGITVWDAQIAGAVTIPGYAGVCPNTASTGSSSCANDHLTLKGAAKTAVLAAGLPATIWCSGRLENIAQITSCGAISDATANNDFEVGVTSPNAPAYAQTHVSGGTIATATTGAGGANGTIVKLSGSAASADYAAVTNGGTVATASTAGALPGGATTVSVGSLGDGTGPWNEYLTGFAIWNQRLPNAKQQAITK